jgi:hypothetical protein
MEKNNRKVSKITANRTNQADGDENEERRGKTNGDAHAMDYKFKKQCIVNLPKKRKEIKCKCYFLMTVGHSIFVC